MSAADRIEEADPPQLVRMLHDAIGWLREEWFGPWIDDPSRRELAAALGVPPDELEPLGTPYLHQRLGEITNLIDTAARGLNATTANRDDAAAQWAAAHRRALAYVVDLYELAAVRHADLRSRMEPVGWDVEPPGLLLSETAEEAITVLYEGLERLGGLLEDVARARGAALPPAGELLEREFADALSDGDRFMDAYRRAWGISRGRSGP